MVCLRRALLGELFGLSGWGLVWVVVGGWWVVGCGGGSFVVGHPEGIGVVPEAQAAVGWCWLSQGCGFAACASGATPIVLCMPDDERTPASGGIVALRLPRRCTVGSGGLKKLLPFWPIWLAFVFEHVYTESRWSNTYSRRV